MSENKNTKTPADGPEYERGFVDGMQRQMQSSVDKALNEKRESGTWREVTYDQLMEEVRNAPSKREWQGLTGDEARKFFEKYTDREELIHAIDRFLEEKNNG